MEFYRSFQVCHERWLFLIMLCAEVRREHQPWGVESGKYVWIHILISDSYGIYPENKGFLDFGGPFVKPSTAVSFRNKKWKNQMELIFLHTGFSKINTQVLQKKQENDFNIMSFLKPSFQSPIFLLLWFFLKSGAWIHLL